MILGSHTSSLGGLGAQLGSIGGTIVVIYPALIRFTAEILVAAMIMAESITQATATGDTITESGIIDSDFES